VIVEDTKHTCPTLSDSPLFRFFTFRFHLLLRSALSKQKCWAVASKWKRRFMPYRLALGGSVGGREGADLVEGEEPLSSPLMATTNASSTHTMPFFLPLRHAAVRASSSTKQTNKDYVLLMSCLSFLAFIERHEWCFNL